MATPRFEEAQSNPSLSADERLNVPSLTAAPKSAKSASFKSSIAVKTPPKAIDLKVSSTPPQRHSLVRVDGMLRSPSANVKSTSFMDLKGQRQQPSPPGADEEEEFDEEQDLYGAAQGLGFHAPKKSAGNMSRMSKNSGASSDRQDRLNQIFIMPFIRAASRFNESQAGRYISRFLEKVTTKVFFWYVSFNILFQVVSEFGQHRYNPADILHHFKYDALPNLSNKDTVLPSIHSYNLVHVIVVILGNFQAFCSYKLCHEVIVAISAHELLKSVSINVFTPTYNPSSGYKVLFSCITSLDSSSLGTYCTEF
jgi:hypothetical protein